MYSVSPLINNVLVFIMKLLVLLTLLSYYYYYFDVNKRPHALKASHEPLPRRP